MPDIRTDILSIHFSPDFTTVRTSGQGASGEYMTDEGSVVLDIYPADKPLLHKTETGQAEQYRTFCSKIYGKLNWLDEKNINSGRHSAWLMTAEGVYGFAHLFVFIPLTDTLCLVATGLCPQAPQQQQHFLTMEHALRTLRIVTDTPETALQAHIQALAAEGDISAALRLENSTSTTPEDTACRPVFDWPAVSSDLQRYLAAYSPLRKPQMDALFPNHATDPIAHAIASTLRSSIDFYHGTEDDYTMPGHHRLGGLPDLPADIDYPCVAMDEESMAECDACWQDDDNGISRCIFPWDDMAQVYCVPLEFIGQLDCRNLAPLQDFLPREGTLFFFLECDSSPWNASGKVIYVPDSGSLKSGIRFASLAFNSEQTLGQKPAFRLIPKASVTQPDFYSLSQNPHLKKRLYSCLNQQQQALPDDDVFRDAQYSPTFPEYYPWQLRQMGAFDLLPGY